jgi:hypothetical protein
MYSKIKKPLTNYVNGFFEPNVLGGMRGLKPSTPVSLHYATDRIRFEESIR